LDPIDGPHFSAPTLLHQLLCLYVCVINGDNLLDWEGSILPNLSVSMETELTLLRLNRSKSQN